MIGRRQFVQLAIASTVATIVSGNAKKTLAHEVSSSLICGVSASSGKVIVQSLDLNESTITDLSGDSADLILEPNERIGGFTLLSDCTFILSTAPTTAAVTGRTKLATKLISLASQDLPALQGLNPNSTIESLLVTNDDRLLSIVSLNQGTPPFRLAKIDLHTGQVSFIDCLSLPSDRRFSNLSQCPDGHIYATSIAADSFTSLVQLDLDNQNIITLSQLNYNNRPLRDDVASLAYSPSHQLFALADPTYEGTNSVFKVDENTGAMELLANFAVDKIAFACV